MQERCVAMESLMWLTDVMRSSRSRFEALLPHSCWPSMDLFYARTVSALETPSEDCIDLFYALK